jgi:hypothetical protein
LGQDPSDGKIHTLLVEVVLEDDEPAVELRHVGVENGVEPREGRSAVGSSTWDVPIGL